MKLHASLSEISLFRYFAISLFRYLATSLPSYFATSQLTLPL